MFVPSLNPQTDKHRFTSNGLNASQHFPPLSSHRRFRQSTPPNRDSHLPPAEYTSHSPGFLHQWPGKGHLRQESRERADIEKGGVAEGCEWREGEKGQGRQGGG